MSERLTERNANGTAKSRKSPKSSYMVTVYEEMAEIQTEILNRLCDLEDKIEQGKIVELPCAVGQKVYVLSRYYGSEWKVYECRVYEYTIYEHNIFMRITNSDYNFGASVREIGVSVFLTKEAAEAKLREMEGENDEQQRH